MTSVRPVERADAAAAGRGAAEAAAEPGRGAEGRGVDGLILNLGGIVYVILYTKYAFNFILVWISLICGYSFYDVVAFYANDGLIVFCEIHRVFLL
jgi:hypothetical protein